MSWRSLLAVAVALAGCGVDPPCPAASLPALTRDPAWAVVTSDYESTAIALLDAQGELITEAWVDSGTAEPGIVAALSGDVVLPTDPVPGELVLIDRLGVDVVTRISLPGGEVRAQLPTQLSREESTSGFRANPHDAVFLEDGRVLVSRFEPNPDRAAPPLDRGNDLVFVDGAGGELLERTDLSLADVPRDDPRDPTHWARPSRMTRVGDRVAVGLGRLSSYWVAATGAIAVVDPLASPPSVQLTILDGLAGCELVRAAPGPERRVISLCYGDPFMPDTLDGSTTAHRRRRAGLVSLVVDDSGAASIEHLWRAAADEEGPVPTGSLVALGDTRVAFTAQGDAREDRPDRMYVTDLATGEMRLVLEAEPYALGTGVFDVDHRTLLVPDADRGIRRARIAEDLGATELPAVDASPCRDLPPREIARLLPP